MYITDLQEDDLEISIKVVIVGNGAVGKSSMIQRYCRGIFTKSYKKTIGVDFLEKQLRISGEDVRLMLWDTAGQEEFDAITKAYYRGAQACVIAFSTTDRNSFEAVKKWKKKVEDECGSVPMVLVQNKIDLQHESVVNNEEVERLCKECQMRLYRTSVKDDLNVVNVFQHLSENYVNLYLNQVNYNNLPSFNNPVLQIGGNEIGGGGGGNFHHQSKYNNHKNRFRIGGGGNGNGSNAGYYNNYRTNQSCTPQDYLNNPMFDSLHNRRYWPSDRTITLRPLVNLTKKQHKNIHRKLPINKNSCKVL